MKLALLLALFPLLGSAIAVAPGGDPFIEKYLSTAERLREDGDEIGARAAVERALERDDQHLGALKILAELATASEDFDTRRLGLPPLVAGRGIGRKAARFAFGAQSRARSSGARR